MKKIVLLKAFILFCGMNAAWAQDTTRNTISFTTFGGMPSSTFTNHVKGYSYGSEIEYHLTMANNQAPWVKAAHVKDMGILFSYMNMQHVSLKGLPGTQNLTGSIYTVAGSANMVW